MDKDKKQSVFKMFPKLNAEHFEKKRRKIKTKIVSISFTMCDIVSWITNEYKKKTLHLNGIQFSELYWQRCFMLNLKKKKERKKIEKSNDTLTTKKWIIKQ